MKITTDLVSGLEVSKKYMRYPKMSKDIDNGLDVKLANCKIGTGHDSFLKGIIVHCTVKATHDIILQWYRYSFRDTVSSESKMHGILKADIEAHYTKDVSSKTIRMLETLVYTYNRGTMASGEINGMNMFYGIKVKTKEDLFEAIIHNTPLGYQLQFGEVISYLQLKTMYSQRKNHKLSFWNTVFVNWIKTLPEYWLITGEK